MQVVISLRLHAKRTMTVKPFTGNHIALLLHKSRVIFGDRLEQITASGGNIAIAIPIASRQHKRLVVKAIIGYSPYPFL